MVKSGRGTRAFYLQYLCSTVDRLTIAITSHTVQPQEHGFFGKPWARMNSSA